MADTRVISNPSSKETRSVKKTDIENYQFAGYTKPSRHKSSDTTNEVAAADVTTSKKEKASTKGKALKKEKALKKADALKSEGVSISSKAASLVGKIKAVCLGDGHDSKDKQSGEVVASVDVADVSDTTDTFQSFCLDDPNVEILEVPVQDNLISLEAVRESHKALESRKAQADDEVRSAKVSALRPSSANDKAKSSKANNNTNKVSKTSQKPSYKSSNDDDYTNDETIVSMIFNNLMETSYSKLISALILCELIVLIFLGSSSNKDTTTVTTLSIDTGSNVTSEDIASSAVKITPVMYNSYATALSEYSDTNRLVPVAQQVVDVGDATFFNSDFGSNDTMILFSSRDDLKQYLTEDELTNNTYINLLDICETYPKAKLLIARHDKYPMALLELAANRPETIPFVVDYVKYESTDYTSDTDTISIAGDVTEGAIPLFIQWDKRWGYKLYGDEFIATSGCGPTCLSMVAVGLTNNTELNPKTVADFSLAKGYYIPGQGTSWSLMTDGASELGLVSKVLPLNENTIRAALKAGYPIIASMKPGHFTAEGHFIVLRGLSEDGKVLVNDPGSILNSQMEWDMSVILNEVKNIWAFAKA